MSDYSGYDNFSDREFQPPDVWLKIEARIKADRVELLIGLETWLQLGLISQAQVKEIARTRLCCAISIEEFLPPSPPTKVVSVTPDLALATPNLLQRIWQSCLDELSIRWLLFLGIFLVVVSSGVLAASQWQHFSDYAQYSILLLYSLGFWGIGFWTGKQSGLKLTSQTLKAIATLLIPINFWALGHLGLLFQPMGWGIVVLSAIVLSTTRLALVKQNRYVASIAFLLLSYCHLGWQIASLPQLAVYGGIVMVVGLDRFWLKKSPPLDLLYVLAAWLLLLCRELITTFDSSFNYSLAIAIFAWLLCTIYLDRARQTKLIALRHKSLAINHVLLGNIIKIFASIVFIAVWVISLQAGITRSNLFFWQNVAISSLAINLFWQRFTLYWRRWDLTTIFLLGLQTLYLSKELIPDSLRTQTLDLSVWISNSDYFPESVLGVSLFPYLILFVFVASWLYRLQKTRLGLWTEYLTLLLGIVFTCLSYVNPTWRSLNLFCSTLTLGYVASIRLPIRPSLIYSTHLLTTITIVNAIAVVLPNLTTLWWGSILVALVVVNWSICLMQKQRRSISLYSLISQSCWYAGLLLGALSYTCFLAVMPRFGWGLVWFVVPVMAMAIARYTRKIGQRRQATIVSCLALLSAQILVFGDDITRLIGLAIATVLMLANGFHLRRTSITMIHLGMAIALYACLFNLSIDYRWDNYRQWLLVGNLAILLLYRLRSSLIKTSHTPKFGYISQRNAFGILGVGRETQNFKLIDKYIKAADYWAIALIALILPIISVTYFWLPNLAIDSNFFAYLFATGLLASLLFWRYQNHPNHFVLYTLVWLGGIFILGLARVVSSSSIFLATGNILLGLIALVGVVLIAQTDTPWAKLDLAFVPFIYAALSIYWRLSNFNAYTGLLTLGAAIILLCIQPRNRQLGKTIKYLGFAAVSIGIYELVIDRMQSADGGSIADALTILSLVAAAIAFSYRSVAYWYAAQAVKTVFNLSLSKFILIAHCHWAASSILKIIAAGIAIEYDSPRLTLISIATSFCLGAYAVIQGRDKSIHTLQHQDWWVYVGLVEITATLVYSRLIIARLSFFDPWRILFTCAIALLIYQIPWQNFGWRSTPWQRSAIATPALMALAMAEDISYWSLLVTALFYLRIASAQKNIRWSYISLGLLNWMGLSAIAQYSFDSIWIAVIVSCSILYVAQLDPYLQSQRQPRHYLRLAGSSILCLTILWQQSGITTGIIAFSFILLGLGLKIRAYLFIGTITLILTVLQQLIISILTYSFLKWIVGLLTGIGTIAIAAGFERQRDRVESRLRIYHTQLQTWQ